MFRFIVNNAHTHITALLATNTLLDHDDIDNVLDFVTNKWMDGWLLYSNYAVEKV